MGYGIRLEAWGPYALFSRPEMKTERASYEVMTPSAARGLIEAVYWHPGLRWVVESIFVRNPIRFTNIRRNEVKAKILASDLRAACEGNTRRCSSTRRSRSSSARRACSRTCATSFRRTSR